jgi:hypothetical protein
MDYARGGKRVYPQLTYFCISRLSKLFLTTWFLRVYYTDMTYFSCMPPSTWFNIFGGHICNTSQGSARLSKKSWSRQLLLSLAWSWSRQPPKYPVSRSLGIDNLRYFKSLVVSFLTPNHSEGEFRKGVPKIILFSNRPQLTSYGVSRLVLSPIVTQPAT